MGLSLLREFRFPRESEILISQSLARRPTQRPPTQQVDVQMKHRLSGAGADIEDGAVSMLDSALACDLSGREMAAADDLGVCGLGFFQSCEMSFRNNEYVCGRLRMDIFEGENVVVFMNFFGRNLAAEDAAEQAIRMGHRAVHLAATITLVR